MQVKSFLCLITRAADLSQNAACLKASGKPILRAVMISDLWSTEDYERGIKNTFVSVYDINLNHPAREQILSVPRICKPTNTRLPECFSWLMSKLYIFQFMPKMCLAVILPLAMLYRKCGTLLTNQTCKLSLSTVVLPL